MSETILPIGLSYVHSYTYGISNLRNLLYLIPSDASEIVITVLAIIAGVAFWLEYRHNSRVNEAQFVMDLNDQFITDEKMSAVEHDLELYYADVRAGNATDDEKLRTKYDLESEYRQHLVNYLVHLEGVSMLVNTGVLRISTITDLMTYRSWQRLRCM